MAKYLSGRFKKTPQSKLPEDRNRYLSVGDAEPNLGDPTINSTEGVLPVGEQYQIISILGYSGERYWIPRGGGLIPGSISVYDENFLVGTSNSITQLNFVGAAITVRAVPLGIAATITVFSPGNNQEILFNTNNDFGTSSKLKFDSNIGLLSAGDRISVGSGGTVITTTSGGLVGIGTTNPTQELHILGDLRLTGTIYDSLNDPGDVNQVIVKNNLGGLLWVDQGTIKSGAGGTYRDIQFHNSAGLVDGASNFVFDEINSRIGIGSTQPKVLLDVLGISRFKGGTTIDNLNVTGITTTLTLAVSGTTTTRNLQVTGVTTIGFVTGTSAFFTGIVTATKFVGEVNVSNLYVTGVSTFLQKVNINSDLGVTGLTTTQNLQVYQSTTLNRLKVSGISTFDTQVNVNNLNVTGVGTFDNIKIYDNNIETTVGNLILNSNAGTTQINDAVYVNDTTQSISKDTGSIVTEGGVGIEKDLYVGGNLYVDGDIVADSADKVSTGTTTGTTTYFPTFVDSNNSTRDNEFLYTDAGISYNPSTNSLGIGTNNPQATLDVGIGSVYVSAGDIHGNGTLILFNTRDGYGGVFLNGGTDGDAYINNINPGGSTGFAVKLPSGSAGSFGAPNYENLYTTVETRHNGTEGITYFNGLVGIGTTNPSFRLQVDGDIYLNSRLVTSGSAVESSGTIIFSAVSSTSNIDHIWNSDVNVVDGVVGTQYGNLPGIYHFVNDGTYKSTGNSALRAGGFFNIDHTGTLNQKLQISGGAYISDNLGIGITNPTSKLQVAGNVTPSVTNTYDLGTESLKWNNIYANSFVGTIIGNADSATKLATPREIDISGDVIGVGIGTTFDGSRNVTIPTELSTTGVVAGTYGSSTRVGIVTVDAKGRITSASNVNIDFSRATYADNAGISTNADNIKTVSSTATTLYPTFVDSNNSPAAYEALYTDAGISYNASTNLLTASNITVSGISTFNGNVTIGNATSDTVTFTSRINSNVLPSTNGTLDLGGTSNKWATVYATNFNGQFIGNADTATRLATPREIDISGDVIGVGIGTTFDGSRNVTIPTELSTTGVTAGTYGSSTQVPVFAVDAKGRVTSVTNTGVNFSTATVLNSDNIKTVTSSATTLYPTFVDSNNSPADYDALYTDAGISYNASTNLLTLTNLTVSGISTFNGNVTLGDATSDTVTFTARVDSNILPSTNGTLDLGGASNKWATVYATNFNGQFIGNADTTTKLATPREIDISGDVIGVGIGTTFDGSRNVTIPTELSTTGVTAGTYGSSTRVGVVTVDAKGRITSASNVNIDFSKATYADNAGISTNLKGGIASQIPYQSAANTTAFIPNGTSGQLLRSNGTSAPSWVTATDLSVSKATYADNAGISTNADNIKTVSSTATTLYPTFVDSNNSPAAYEALYTDAGISYNASANLLTLTNLTVSGISTFNGNVTLGDDANVDTVTFTAKVDSDIIPSGTTRDLGSTANKWNNIYANSFVGTITGNADTATKLATERNIAITGDLAWNVNFDGSTNVTSTGTLANSGVTAGTYGSATTVPVFAVDAKGRVTSVTNTGINFSGTFTGKFPVNTWINSTDDQSRFYFSDNATTYFGSPNGVYRWRNSLNDADIMKLDNNGNFVSETGDFRTGGSSNANSPAADNANDAATINSSGLISGSRHNAHCLSINRGGSDPDGNLAIFYRRAVIVGSIKTNPGTVTYNPFLGSHWGRFQDNTKPDILIGTILETVNQLIEWKIAVFTVDGEEKLAAYHGFAEVGDTVQFEYEGALYSALIRNEEEGLDEINKHVCVKVNDTAASKAVLGVFLGWENDIPDNMVSTWNDLNCASVGNYFVRIKKGEVLSIGDLIEADGNGCGVIQDDDIIRTKTVAKVTTTISQLTYDDGSFLVTCVLYCG